MFCSVTFYANGTELTTVTVSAGGTATYSSETLSSGTNVITATYWATVISRLVRQVPTICIWLILGVEWKLYRFYLSNSATVAGDGFFAWLSTYCWFHPGGSVR